MNGKLLEVVDTRLYGHLDIDAAQCTAGRVDGHLAIEGGVEGILGLEMQYVMLLIAHLHAIGQVILIIGIARCRQRTQQRCAEKG